MNVISQYNFFPKQPPSFNIIETGHEIIESTNQLLDSLENEFGFLEINFSSQDSKSNFLKLPDDKKQSTFLKLKNYYHFLSGMIEKEVDLNDNPSCLKTVFDKMGLSVSDQFFKNLTNTDVVEVYDNSFIQIFRNLNCLKFTSYDVLTLSSYDWTELFERDATINSSLIEEAVLLLSENKDLYRSKVEEHLLIERFSAKKNKMIIKNKIGASLLNPNNEIVGFVATQTAKLVDNNTNLGFLRSH